MVCQIDTFMGLVGTAAKSESFWNPIVAKIFYLKIFIENSTSLDFAFFDNLDFYQKLNIYGRRIS